MLIDSSRKLVDREAMSTVETENLSGLCVELLPTMNIRGSGLYLNQPQLSEMVSGNG